MVVGGKMRRMQGLGVERGTSGGRGSLYYSVEKYYGD